MMDKSFFLTQVFKFYPVGKIDLIDIYEGRKDYYGILEKKIISVEKNSDELWSSLKIQWNIKHHDFSFHQFPNRMVHFPLDSQQGVSLVLVYSLLTPFYTMFWEDKNSRVLRVSCDEYELAIYQHVKTCFEIAYKEIRFASHIFLMTEKIKGGDLYGDIHDPKMNKVISFFEFLFSDYYRDLDYSVH